MKKYQTIFKIDHDNKIAVKLTAPLKKLHYGDWAHVILKTRTKSYKIMSDDIALECFRALYYKLEEIIEEKLIFNPLIQEDLGLIWNQILKRKRRSRVPFELIDGEQYWLGRRHKMWSNPNTTTTWIFKKNNKIYLEVTPTYPWIFSKPKPKDKFYTFDEFVKNYKPLIILEIDMATAEKWYKKVSKILIDMQHNDDSLRIAYYKKLQEEQAF